VCLAQRLEKILAAATAARLHRRVRAGEAEIDASGRRHPSGDIRGRVDDIDIKRCPLFLLTGEYDYPCTSEATLDIAKRTGAQATIMKGLGHIPISEDPEKFLSYLLPVLEKTRAL
jgi:pimeloyl-ACP methyl ester carboxylesterase